MSVIFALVAPIYAPRLLSYDTPPASPAMHFINTDPSANAVAIDAANKIKSAMKTKKKECFAALDDERETVNQLRAAHCMYDTIKNYNSEINFILVKLRLRQDQLIPIIQKGEALGWTDKRIHREMIMSLSIGDLVYLGW